MNAQSRIKNAKGHWLSQVPNTQLGKGTPWLSKSFLDSMREASALPGAAPELVKFANIASKATLHSGPAFMDPHTPESEAQWDEWCATERPEAERAWDSHYSYRHHSNHNSASAKEAYVQERLRKGKIKFQPTTPMSWLFAPAPYTLCWTEDPGKAALFNGSEAPDLKAHCETLVALAKLLPKALKSAHKLGAQFDPRARAGDKLLPGVPLVANGQVMPFEPESEYLSRECFALYVENEQKKGFVTHKDGVIKPDLGSARLFPTKTEAAHFGWRYRDFALVTVNIAPQSFERRGSAGDMLDLAAAISAKEALEIELALKNADIERLRQALQEREQNEPPAPAPAPRPNRL